MDRFIQGLVFGMLSGIGTGVCLALSLWVPLAISWGVVVVVAVGLYGLLWLLSPPGSRR